MNYRQIVNLYKKNKFSELDNLALACAHFDLIINFTEDHVFFNYRNLGIEFIVRAKDNFEMHAYKYFSVQVKANCDYLIELKHELQRNR